MAPELAEARERFPATSGPAVNNDIGGTSEKVMLGARLGLEASYDLQNKSSIDGTGTFGPFGPFGPFGRA
jgi:hypothetical protein